MKFEMQVDQEEMVAILAGVLSEQLSRSSSEIGGVLESIMYEPLLHSLREAFTEIFSNPDRAAKWLKEYINLGILEASASTKEIMEEAGYDFSNRIDALEKEIRKLKKKKK